MDLVLKIENAEKLRYFQEKMGAKQLVIDVEKVIKDSEEFNKIFDDSCKKYVENDVKALKKMVDLTYDNKPDYDSMTEDVVLYDEEAEKSYLKTVTERIKSEFDATGNDVKIFMENKVKYGGLLGKETVDFMNGEGKYSEKPYAQIEREYVGANKFKKHYMCPFCKNITDKPHIYNGAWFECKSCGRQLYIQ